jgi:hypothetical protein
VTRPSQHGGTLGQINQGKERNNRFPIPFQEVGLCSKDLMHVQKMCKFLCFLKLPPKHHGHFPSQSANPAKKTHVFSIEVGNGCVTMPDVYTS